MSGRGRGGAAAVAAVLVAVAGGAVHAEPRVEKVDVPRDLGALPQVDVVWAPPTDANAYAAHLLVVEHAEERGLVRAMANVQAGWDSRELWRMTLDPDDYLLTATGIEDVAVLALRRELVGLDGRTGRRRWSVGGRVDWVRPLGRDLLVAFEMPPLDPAAAEYAHAWPRDLTRLDGRTGRPRWRVPCVDKLCALTAVSGEQVVVTGHEAVARLDAATGRTLSTLKRSEVTAFISANVAIAGDVAVLAAPAGASKKAGLVVEALSLADGTARWRTPLPAAGDASFYAHAQPRADRLVAVAGNVIAVLRWSDGALLSTASLPAGWRGGRPLVLPGGPLGVPETNDGAAVLAIVDPGGAKPVSLWALPGEVQLELTDDRVRVFDRKGWGTIRQTFLKESGWTSTLPPPRARLSLADDVAARLDRLAAAAAASDGREAPDREGTLPFLRRLPAETYRGAVLARIRRGAVGSRELLALLAGPDGAKSDAAFREACAEGIRRVTAELPRADARARLRLVRASLDLMEATTGGLPEAPVRAVGAALAELVRDTWAHLSQPARAALGIAHLHGGPGLPWYGEVAAAESVVDESARFFGLLWRAPYPDLDKPLREAVTAVGPARPCPYPMADPYHPSPLRPPDLSCQPDAPPVKAVRGTDWAVWATSALGRSDDAWGMTHAGPRWSEPRYLGSNATARAVLAAGRATAEERLELMAALAFAARDGDADGLPDAIEATLGLDPARADTDGDGVPDGRDPSPLCAPVARPLTRDEQITADLAWVELGLRTEALPALLELPDAPGGGAPACVEVPTLGGPVIVGSEAAVKALKARLEHVPIYSGGAKDPSPEGRARARELEGTLRGAPTSEAAWGMFRASLNAGGSRVVVARIAGRWRIVSVLMRVVS